MTELEANARFQSEGWYHYLLEALHAHLRPRSYVEIGVNKGRSIAAVQPETDAIGVDPAPRVAYPLTSRTRIYTETSDAFFGRPDIDDVLGHEPIDMAFIDGMHLFEFAFRDFRNLELRGHHGSVVLIHDCLPPNAAVAYREPVLVGWTGDVWKLLCCLRDYRPDLSVHVVAAGPTGLGIVTNLDPSNRVLWDREREILGGYVPLGYDAFLARADDVLRLVPNAWDDVQAIIPADAYQPPDPTVDGGKSWPRTWRAYRRRMRLWFSGTPVAGWARRFRSR